MPRKSYSIEERQRVKEALMTTVLQCIIDRGLIHSSIDVLCRKVGISKTFFYIAFPNFICNIDIMPFIFNAL